MPLSEAETLVARVRASVMRTALARLSELRDELQPQCTIAAMTLRNPPLANVPVTVAEAHTSYPVMCRADAMLYHDALSTAARRMEIALELHDRGTEVVSAAARFGVSVEELEHFLHNAGEHLGTPWRKEHRLATAAAMEVLAHRGRVSLVARS